MHVLGNNTLDDNASISPEHVVGRGIAYSQQAAKSATHQTCRVEQCEPLRELIWLVPTTQEQHHSREETYITRNQLKLHLPLMRILTSLYQSQTESEGDQAAQVVDTLGADGHCTLPLRDQRCILLGAETYLTHANISAGRKILGLDRARSMFDGTSFKR